MYFSSMKRDSSAFSLLSLLHPLQDKQRSDHKTGAEDSGDQNPLDSDGFQQEIDHQKRYEHREPKQQGWQR